MDIRPGDTLIMKKKHPCGSCRWTVLRTGMDFKLRCEGCGHQVEGARGGFEKNVKSIERKDEA